VLAPVGVIEGVLPPLHATSPFGLDIQLAYAVCTIVGIITLTTIAAVARRAKVTVAIAAIAVVPNLVVVFVVWSIFYLLLYDTVIN
jgi:hypothetical protein